VRTVAPMPIGPSCLRGRSYDRAVVKRGSVAGWVAVLVVLASLSFPVGWAGASRVGTPPFTVRSTLSGHPVLPHRIHWLGVPSLPAARVSEVDFLIDGKLRWVEHHRPYSYGYDADYLVTSWLTAGTHTFAVRAISTDHRRAITSSTARVGTASAPPAKLTGSWQRTLSAAQAGKQPSGIWKLTVDKVGWRIEVPPGGANLIDVGYLSPGRLELRGGIWTKPAPKDNPVEGNGWCDEPFQPVRYTWSVERRTLTLALDGPRRCDGQSTIVAGTWTRA
jgi:hypothetical protein